MVLPVGNQYQFGHFSIVSEFLKLGIEVYHHSAGGTGGLDAVAVGHGGLSTLKTDC